MGKRLLFFAALLLSFANAIVCEAQDVKAYVRINTEKIEGTNKDIYNELSNDLTEFINSRRWTDRMRFGVPSVTVGSSVTCPNVPHCTTT